jgi:hypothetical protein
MDPAPNPRGEATPGGRLVSRRPKSDDKECLCHAQPGNPFLRYAKSRSGLVGADRLSVVPRWRNASGGTDVVHGENFKGLLVGVIKLERIKGEYEQMNRDMVAEIARRYPVSTGA